MTERMHYGTGGSASYAAPPYPPPPFPNQEVMRQGDAIMIPSKPHYGKAPKDSYVKFGNHIALKHTITGRFLGSDNDRYKTGSGQQMVFAHKWSVKDKDWWIVMPALSSFSEPGDKITYGSIIRLKHVKTRANLHSHPGFGSPSTGQQEVTAFGTHDRESDENDEWRLLHYENAAAQDPWRIGETFILQHVVTNHSLHSHDIRLKHHDSHNEITAFAGKDDNDKWRVVLD
ncbi:hypothetical protein INT43_000692 [Umbelopsis isabellina]|uniref:MIR domain-containing protein n=1 Tax=Mortierella isabellina TaxID=91625 RepID=A0A8H7UN03_MORIS|nr:hypothetical protein INT43_000692 [Umbelopsis isabellina]